MNGLKINYSKTFERIKLRRDNYDLQSHNVQFDMKNEYLKDDIYHELVELPEDCMSSV